MRKLVFIFCLCTLFSRIAYAQEPEQDCLNAIPVCNEDVYSQENSYVGEGDNPDEIDSDNSCLGDGEKNGVWYKITIPNDGTLQFTITPYFILDDYDWAVYNLTNASCADIANMESLQVSCNFSGDYGTTGANGGSSETSQDAGGTPDNATIPVQTGETYYIYISNYSDTQSGYTIDFTGSPTPFCAQAGNILAAIQPANNCAINTILVKFNHPVMCNSVQATDFKFKAPSGLNVPILSFMSPNCGGQPSDDTFIMTTTQALTESGVYRLSLVNTIVDNSGQSYTSDFVENIIQPTTSNLRFFTVMRKSYVCADCTDGKIVISGIGGIKPYQFSIDGQSFQSSGVFSDLAPGVYTLTIKDAAGCTVTRTVTIGS